MSLPSRHSLTLSGSNVMRERTMVEKSPKYSHQSTGAVENAVRRIESLTRTYVCALQEKLGYNADSKILPWLVRHAAYVLSRCVKRDDGRSAWARLRGKECDSPFETVDFKIVRGEMAKLEPRWATGTFLGRTDESDEVIVGAAVGVEFARSFRRRTRDKQWQRDAFTTFIDVPWNPRGLAVETPVASNRRRHITKSLVQQHGETPGCSASLGVSSKHTTKCRERFERLINPNATDVECCGRSKSGWRWSVSRAAACDTARHIETRSSNCSNKKRSGGQSDVFVSKESSHTSSSIIPDLTRCRNGDGAGARRCD